MHQSAMKPAKHPVETSDVVATVLDANPSAGHQARSYDGILDGLTAPSEGKVADSSGPTNAATALRDEAAPGGGGESQPETEEKEGEKETKEGDAKTEGKSGSESGTLAEVAGPTGGSVSQGDEMMVLDGPEAPIVADGPADAVADPVDLTIASTVTFAGTVGNGFAAPAFGQMDPTITFSGFSYTRSGNTITLSGSIAGDFQWGVNAGGRTDVTSGAADVVTLEEHPSSGKKVWETIVDDLTPSNASPHKSPRSHYWSEALTAQHEEFHAVDFKDWCTSTGRPDAVSYFNARTISSADINGGLQTMVSGCRSDFVRMMFEYYLGGPSPVAHSSRAGEITAYADGKDGYEALAEAVKTQAAALEAAAVPAPE
ncbi:MAG: hypothetical protein ACI9MR_001220 [Myxococcota bacterium]|jgi:hypothetical protein